jgi:hypothetical protein
MHPNVELCVVEPQEAAFASWLDLGKQRFGDMSVEHVESLQVIVHN